MAIKSVFNYTIMTSGYFTELEEDYRTQNKQTIPLITCLHCNISAIT